VGSEMCIRDMVELADLRKKISKNSRIIKKPHQIINKHLKIK
jgi:hypothetical protein